MFHNLQGNPITFERWKTTFSRMYLDGDHRVFAGANVNIQATSHFVEDTVCALLQKTSSTLTPDEIKLIYAWKTGMIYHSRSERAHRIIFHDNIENGLNRFGKPIGKFLDEAYRLFHQTNPATLNPRQFFDHLRVAGNGNAPVYAITYLFFFTQLQQPIYDRFAWLATEGLINNQPPARQYGYGEQVEWNRYEEYKKRLVNVFGTSAIDRDTDRALYVYGHFFKRAGIAGGCGDGGERVVALPPMVPGGQRKAVVANDFLEIQFRPYQAWVGTLPEHDALITLNFGEHWVVCALGNKSRQFWTKRPQETDLGEKSWKEFFIATGIMDKQEFKVDVIDENEYELSPVV